MRAPCDGFAPSFTSRGCEPVSLFGRIVASALAATSLSSAPPAPSCALQVVATGASNGVLRVWELSHYAVKAHIAPPGAKGASPTCLAFALGGLVSGWSDGCVRCHSETGSPMWDMPCTHAGGVYSIAFGPRWGFSGLRRGATLGVSRGWGYCGGAARLE